MVDVNNKKNLNIPLGKYNLFIKNIWKWDKSLFLLSTIQIPAIVIIPLLGIYLP